MCKQFSNTIITILFYASLWKYTRSYIKANYIADAGGLLQKFYYCYKMKRTIGSERGTVWKDTIDIVPARDRGETSEIHPADQSASLFASEK